MLLCKPIGRGNWHTVEVTLAGKRAPLPLEVHVGQLLTIAGRVFRVCKVVLS